MYNKCRRFGDGVREFECGQSRTHYPDFNGFETASGNTIPHFSMDNFNFTMAPGTFCDIGESEEMAEYEPGTRRRRRHRPCWR